MGDLWVVDGDKWEIAANYEEEKTLWHIDSYGCRRIVCHVTPKMASQLARLLSNPSEAKVNPDPPDMPDMLERLGYYRGRVDGMMAVLMLGRRRGSEG